MRTREILRGLNRIFPDGRAAISDRFGSSVFSVWRWDDGSEWTYYSRHDAEGLVLADMLRREAERLANGEEKK